MHPMTIDRLAAQGPNARAIARSSRVLNYDLARWVTELRPQLQSKQQSLQLEISDTSLPPVLCDRQQLRQVVINLVTTAQTLADVGGRIIVLARAAGRFVTVEVKETGAGLAAADRGREFEPFVRRIVEAHNGSLAVRSEPGDVNTFVLTLPVHTESREIRYSAA